MNLIHSNKVVRRKFPERQFVLGDHVIVRDNWSPQSTYFKGLRVTKILNERIFEVQDQITGSVYETNIDEMFLDITKLPVHTNSID